MTDFQLQTEPTTEEPEEEEVVEEEAEEVPSANVDTSISNLPPYDAETAASMRGEVEAQESELVFPQIIVRGAEGEDLSAFDLQREVGQSQRGTIAVTGYYGSAIYEFGEQDTSIVIRVAGATIAAAAPPEPEEPPVA